MTTAPPDHVLQEMPPWRPSRSTLCGIESDTLAVEPLSLTGIRDRITDLGGRRAAYGTCPRCWSKAIVAATWHEDPLATLTQVGEPLRAEMFAVAELIARHQVEFEQLTRSLAGVVDLTAVRRERAAARAAAVPPSRGSGTP